MLRIGFVYDLRSDYRSLGMTEEETAEFDSDETIRSVEQSLLALGHQVECIGNVRELVSHLATGKTFDFIFNIAEGVSGMAREAQVPALLEAYQIPYSFSTPEVMIKCHDKALAKQLVCQKKLATAPFVLVQSLDDVDTVTLPYPLFLKPVAEGTSKGISDQSLVHDAKSLREQSKRLLEIFNQPVLVEEFLPGREFTVGLLGEHDQTDVLGVLEIILNNHAERAGHTFHNKKNCEELVRYQLAHDETANQAAEVAKQCWKVLGCRDAGRIDIRCDQNGKPCFIEVNPLSGLNPRYSDLCILSGQLNIDHRQLIALIVARSFARYPKLQRYADACINSV